MIITCKKHIPPHWLILTILPWASWMFVNATMSTVGLYSMKKFVENPAGLTFFMSLPGFTSMVLGPVVSFMSDRIWTRYGRRKPFVLTAWCLAATCLALMPVMPTFWLLLAAYLCFSIGADFQGPQEPLKLEVIPPHQRGRAVAGVSWMVQLGLLLFFFVAFGRFDDRQTFLGRALTGEEMIYWAASASMVVMIFLISLGIKEIDPKSPIRGEKLNFKNLFRGILSRDLWPVYSLIFASSMLGAGLGTLGNLLYTEQWRFTKQEMGNNVAIGGIINLFIIPLLGFFADKWNRVRAYQTLIILGIVTNFSFYLYVNFVLYDRRPILLELVLFGEVLSILGVLTGMAFTPMVFDYIPRNEMGTYMAGQGLLHRIVGLVTLNGVGLFVWSYSSLFMPPGGDMARVVFRENIREPEMRTMIAQANWTDPVSGQPRSAKEIKAEPWYATGAVLPFGRCYEVRMVNQNSVQLRSERDAFDEQRAKLAKQSGGDTAALVRQIDEKDAELKRRGEALRDQVNRNFGAKILQPGEQILSAKIGTATLLEFPIEARANGAAVEKTLRTLRVAIPGVIDLRPVMLDSGSGVAVSLENSGVDAAEQVRRILAENLGLPSNSAPKISQSSSMLVLDLLTIEEPLDVHLSPVARAVNAVEGLFTTVPGPERRVNAIGRALRKPGATEHVRVEALDTGKKDDSAIRITALLTPGGEQSATPVSSEIRLKLDSFFPSAPPELREAAAAFYPRIVDACREQRTTIAEPSAASGFVPLKYDYMSGYLWMLLLSLVGLFITFLFIRRERKGLIRKRGLEEAELA